MRRDKKNKGDRRQNKNHVDREGNIFVAQGKDDERGS
jgi:hypothetical protein